MTSLLTHHPRTRSLTLARLLAGLGRTPLDPHMVHRHMATEARQANRWLGVHRAWGPMVHTVVLLWGLSILACVVGVAEALFSGATLLLGLGLLGFVVSVGVMSCLHSLTGRLGIRRAPRGGYVVKTRAVWDAVPLATASASLPASVALLVTELEANAPDCRFILHQLWQGEQIVDPVLAVQLGTQTAFLAIWDAQGRVLALA